MIISPLKISLPLQAFENYSNRSSDANRCFAVAHPDAGAGAA
jgi:hypothetical protein